MISTSLQEGQSRENATAILMVSDMIQDLYLPQRVFNKTSGNASLELFPATTTALHEVEPVYSFLSFKTLRDGKYKPTAILYIYSEPTTPRILTQGVERIPSTFVDMTGKLHDEDYMRTTLAYIKGWIDGISLGH